MNLYTSEASVHCDASVVTLGTFDGVHLGHQRLLKTAADLALTHQLPSVVVTFEPHPYAILAPDRLPPMLVSLEEKARLIALQKIDALIRRPFTHAFAQMEPEAYLAYLVDALHPKYIVVGYNYTFGHKGRGNPELIRQGESRHGYRLLSVEPVRYEGVPVSSTGIRSLLMQGEIERANAMLGRRYLLTIYQKDGAYRISEGMLRPKAGRYEGEIGGVRVPIEIRPEGIIKAPSVADGAKVHEISLIRPIP